MELHALREKPYARIVVPESDGSFTAEIVEFPGCVASGNTAAEALSNVEEVAQDWISAALEQGQEIPEPLEQSRYSGKLVVRMPKGLHKRSALAAEREGVSLNQYIVACIAEQIGTRSRPRPSYPWLQVLTIQVQNPMLAQMIGQHMGAGATSSIGGTKILKLAHAHA